MAARKPSASMLAGYGYASSEEGERYEVVTVGAPLAGLYSLDTPFPVPVEGALLTNNINLDKLVIQKRLGRIEIGDSSGLVTFNICQWGYDFIYLGDPDASPPIPSARYLLRVNGAHLVKRLTTPGELWVGAVSGSSPPTDDDIITESISVLGTAVQKRDFIYYADGVGRPFPLAGSGDNKAAMYIAHPTPSIEVWGSPYDSLAAGTINSEDNSGGFLLSERRYSFLYQYVNAITGAKSVLSAVSNIEETGVGDPGASPPVPNDRSLLHITIPVNAEWISDWSIVRIYRSTGAVPPSDPANWLFEKDVNTTDLNSNPINTTLSILDGDLGDEADEVFSSVPVCKYVLYDPAGDRCLLFGDPNNPNTLYWSEDGDFGSFPVTNSTTIEDNSGDPLQGGCILLGSVYLMKRFRGLFLATANSLGGYNIEKLTNAVGLLSHYSIVTRGGRMFWWSAEGVIECAGQTPVNISDDKIRVLAGRIADCDLPYEIYGIEERRSGAALIHWLYRDPDDQFGYRVTYDVNLRAWSGPHLAGDGDSVAGSTDRVMWNVFGDPRDSTPMRGGINIYTGDRTGRAFRLFTNEDSEDVYTDNGTPYACEFRTPWFGKGQDTLIPRYFEFLVAITPEGLNAGFLQVSMYLDGRQTAEQEHDFTLYDTTSVQYGDRLYAPFRFRCKSLASPARMIQFGLRYDDTGVLEIPHYRLLFNSAEIRMRGIAPNAG